MKCVFKRAAGDLGLSCKTGKSPTIQWTRGIEVDRVKEMEIEAWRWRFTKGAQAQFLSVLEPEVEVGGRERMNYSWEGG